MNTDRVETGPQPPSRKGLLAIAFPAAGAAALSLYLLATSLSAAAQPLGCGAGSGCDAVLSSPFSRVFGLPVGLPAAVVYLLVIAAAWLTRFPHPPHRIRWAHGGLWIAAGTILASASWFLSLQFLAVGALCPWCLAAHALGSLSAFAILGVELAARNFRPGLFAIGMLLTGLLAAAQLLGPEPQARVVPLDARQIEVLDGKLSINLNTAPLLGSSTALQPIVILFDYCCPHCRATHAQLLEVLNSHPDRFALILLPTPLNRDCNPQVEETEPRFAESCELARLALAVWRANREQFAEFDRWMFETEAPRSAHAARARAEQLVGRDALSQALQDDWIDDRIRVHVEAYAASGIDHIPVLLAPGRAGVSGRAHDASALREILQQQLGIALD